MESATQTLTVIQVSFAVKGLVDDSVRTMKIVSTKRFVKRVCVRSNRDYLTSLQSDQTMTF